jgi:hypothetical protein
MQAIKQQQKTNSMKLLENYNKDASKLEAKYSKIFEDTIVANFKKLVRKMLEALGGGTVQVYWGNGGEWLEVNLATGANFTFESGDIETKEMLYTMLPESKYVEYGGFWVSDMQPKDAEHEYKILMDKGTARLWEDFITETQWNHSKFHFVTIKPFEITSK